MSQNQPTASLKSWALPRLQPLLPLPEEDLLEAISYASTLPSAGEVGTHFKDFLGESTESLSFISEFNSRLFPQVTTSRESTTTTTTTRGGGKQGKKSKPALSKYTQAPRQANDGIGGQFGNAAGVYMKGEVEDEYFTGSTGNSRRPSPNPLDSKNTSSKPSPPSAVAAATSSSSSSKPTAAAGTLTSDLINIKTKKPHSKPPTQKTISLTGGTPMRGLTSELSDLESALRALEITTNPTLNLSSPSSLEQRKCDCMGTKHELLIAAPNCLFCGKIVCIKEGLGACTFCGKPLITAAEVQDMVRSLRSERGKERMAQNAADNKRPDVSKTPRPFSSTPTTSNTAGEADDASLAHATAHRDKLLTYQATSAQRTKIIDQASDFETPLSSNGLNPWATPQERALQLKKQQKVMRKMEWCAKDDYEKRRVVVAIDLKGRKVVREMRAVEMPDSEDDEGDGGGGDGEGVEIDRELEKGGENAFLGSGKGGMFSRNPLLKGMVKPIYKPPSAGGSEDPAREGDGEGYKSAGGWRKVQDEMKDNEEIILNGGAQAGGRAEAENVGEEPGYG